MAHWQLGDKPQARSWYDKAVPWMEKNQPKNEELVRFRAEAAALLGVKAKRKMTLEGPGQRTRARRSGRRPGEAGAGKDSLIRFEATWPLRHCREAVSSLPGRSVCAPGRWPFHCNADLTPKKGDDS